MILYLSKNRIENLYAENIIKRPKIIDLLESHKKFSLKLKDVEISTEFDSYHDDYVSMAKEVLCELKAKKRIHYLLNKEHIDLQKYYYILGRLSVDNDSRKNIYDENEYEANDIIGININVPNDYYDKIHINCSVSSIKTMSYHINGESQKKYYFCVCQPFCAEKGRVKMQKSGQRNC